MLDLVRASGVDPANTSRMLDFGCGAGRLTRHLQFLAEGREIFGVDVSAEHIKWCQANLAPPFRFATTTTIPHLPFQDRFFDLICCGSVFTHIDDLAEAWLLELGRILAPEGRLYLTIHDNHTIQLLEGRERNHWLSELVRNSDLYRKGQDNLGMLVIYRDTLSQVFYDLDFFLKLAQQAFEVVSVTEEAYHYQTGIILRRRQPHSEAKYADGSKVH
jgi:SAM-dependent methyltransferase